mgnify:CR=1 FL=1
MFDQETSVTLSHEEALAILVLLQVARIPGLDGDPVQFLTAEQLTTGILCGERSLRARDLARIGADGRIQVQRDILELVGTCGYAEGSLIVTHLVGNSMRSCFAHRRGEIFVLHTTPETGLHCFEGAGDRQALVDAVAAFSGWVEAFQGGEAPVVASRHMLDRAREAAVAQKLVDARKILLGKNNPSEVVERLVELLAAPYELTVVQSVQPRDQDSVAIQSLSVLQTGAQQWLMIQREPGPKEEEMYVLQPATLLQAKAAISALNW